MNNLFSPCSVPGKSTLGNQLTIFMESKYLTIKNKRTQCTHYTPTPASLSVQGGLLHDIEYVFFSSLCTYHFPFFPISARVIGFQNKSLLLLLVHLPICHLVSGLTWGTYILVSDVTH